MGNACSPQPGIQRLKWHGTMYPLTPFATLVAQQKKKPLPWGSTILGKANKAASFNYINHTETMLTLQRITTTASVSSLIPHGITVKQLLSIK